MSIKRRLFISNILMIILPILLSIGVFVAVYFIFVNLTGVNIFPMRQEGRPPPPGFDQSRIHEVLQEDVAFHQIDADRFIVTLPGMPGGPPDRFPFPPIETATLVFILFVFVFLTNRILVKFVFRHIVTSIDVLADGVREIRDGNLTYRIKQDMNNEFDAVCADFNEMATRLNDMVEQRQSDEKNRKELIAGISHDLRTPLTSIKAYIEGLKKGVATTPEMQEKYLETLQCKTADIEYIINQLFLFSKIDIGEFPFYLETVDIGDELSKIVDGLTDEYQERGLTISLKENTVGEYVSIDIVQFRNIIQNILDNSVKYGNEDNSLAEIFCCKSGDGISITIMDNGPGIPEEMLTKIFEVFYRMDSSRTMPSKGSGLGLAICSKIVEQVKGTIRAENADGGGLSVIITLPADRGVEREK